ncbi:MAG: DUF2069 domain-containing protein [Betaproteobacteria bacterium]
MTVKDRAKAARVCHLVAAASLIALIALCLTWEITLAPLRPGGSWLMLKVLPLLVPLRGILHSKRYTYQWSCMMILLYFTEGVVRAWSEPAPSATLALIEIALATIFFFSAVYYTRFTVSAPARKTGAT